KRVGQACIYTLRWAVVMVRNGRLPAGVGALILGGALAFVMTDARFTVNRVIVTGVATLSGPTVAETTGVVGQSVFSVDSAAVARRIAALPGVQRSDIHTEAPDTIVVRIEERQAVLVWDAADQSYLVDEAGDVLGQPDASAPPPLPHLQALAGVPIPTIGGRVSSEPIRAVLALNERLPSDVGLTQAAVTLDPVLGLTVQTGTWRAVLGNDELLGKKLALLKQLLRQPPWVEADLRDPERPVVRTK
ncbi:MAG TPA: FtsQ-type POTRA domain-containing protein, partial [Thermomicrobiales bacterium]